MFLLLQLWTKFPKKEKTFFKKLEHHFLVESTKIERATFPHKSALPKANIKINRMRSAKWTYHKEPSFVSNYFISFDDFTSV